MTRRLAAALLAVAALVPGRAPAAEAPGPSRAYALRAAVDVDGRRVAGEMRLAYWHDGRCPVGTLVFLLAPNRLAEPPDVPVEQRDLRYPAGFEPADLAVTDVRAGDGTPLAFTREGARLVVTLPAPLGPGEATLLALAFETRLPRAEGPVGVLAGVLRVQGGWHPLLAAWDAERCEWRLDRLPPRARFDATLEAPEEVTLVSAGDRVPVAEGPGGSRFVSDGRYLPLAASRRYRVETRVEGPVRLEAYAYGADLGRARRALATAAAASRHFAGRHGPPVRPLVLRFAEAPLGSGLATWAEGVVFLDRRFAKVLAWLRPFHERQVVYRVFQALWAHHLAARGAEPPAWLVETLAAVETDAAEGRVGAAPPRLDRAARRLGFIPIVDEFLYTDVLPNRAVYRQRFTSIEDPADLARLDAPALPGSRIARKLEALVGPGTLADAAAAYAADPAAEDFLAVVSRLAGRDVRPFVEEWTARPRAVDYGVEVGPTRRAPDGGYVTPLRLSARPPQAAPPAGFTGEVPAREAVPVVVSFRRAPSRTEVLETTAGETITLRSPRRPRMVEVDPDGVTEDRWRADNREPPVWRVLLTQFSVSMDIREGEIEFNAAVTARRGLGSGPVYGAGAFREQESVGAGVSVGYGLGEWAGGFRHGVSVGATYERLDPEFGPGTQGVRDIVTVGAGYSVDSRSDGRNPLTGSTAGVSLTWSDEAFASDADYLIARGRATRYFRVGPGQALAVRAELGETLDGTPPFGKGLLLGGFDGLRAYPEDAFSGESLSLGSIEYRFPIVHDLDRWLAGLVGVGRFSGVVGLEAGQVSRGHDPFRWGEFRSGVNVGLRVMVRLLGVSPVLWSFDAAMPLDHGPEPGDTRLYVSASQTF